LIPRYCLFLLRFFGRTIHISHLVDLPESHTSSFFNIAKMRLQFALTMLFALMVTASPITELLNRIKRQIIQTYDVTEVIYNSNGKAVATTILHVTTTVYPSTTLAPVPTATPTDYVSTALYHHNIHRANHSVPLLKWDTKLVASAQVLAATCKWGHSM